MQRRSEGLRVARALGTLALGALGALATFAPARAAADPADDGWSEPEGGAPEPDIGEDGWERKPQERVRLAYSLRSLTTPRRVFDVLVAPSFQALGGGRYAGLIVTGALYGLDDEQEIGVTLWPLTIQQGGLDAGPLTLFTTRRLYRGTSFELGGGLSGTVPIGPQQLAFGLTLPMLWRLTSRVRLDFGLALGLQVADQATFRLGVPLALSVQLSQVMRLGLRPAATVVPQLRTAGMALGFEAVYTISGQQGAFVDLGARFEWPGLLDGEAQGVVVLNRWLAGLTARFYVPATNPHEGSFDF